MPPTSHTNRAGQYKEANRFQSELANHWVSDGDWQTNDDAACARKFQSNSRFSTGHQFQSQRLFEEAVQLADDYQAQMTNGDFANDYNAWHW